MNTNHQHCISTDKRRLISALTLALGASLLILLLTGCPSELHPPDDQPNPPDLQDGMCLVPAGWFTMGVAYQEDHDASSAEAPKHQVYLNAYRISLYEVTNGEFVATLNWALAKGELDNEDGSPYDGSGFGGVWTRGKEVLSYWWTDIVFENGQFQVQDRDGYSMEEHPVCVVSWCGAVAYCNWLSISKGLTPCYSWITWQRISGDGYRLPTEAEWERAAGWAGNGHWKYAFSSNLIDFTRCNYTIYSGGDIYSANPLGLTYWPFTSPTGWYDGINPSTARSVSPVGCYDMSGNIKEWCEDWYGAYYSQDQYNPTGPSSGTEKVVRGGGATSAPEDCRVTARDSWEPDSPQTSIGFRITR